MKNLKQVTVIVVLAVAGATFSTSSGAFAAGISQGSSSAGQTITKAARCFTMCTPGPVRVPCKAGQAGRFIVCKAIRCSRICVPAI